NGADKQENGCRRAKHPGTPDSHVPFLKSPLLSKDDCSTTQTAPHRRKIMNAAGEKRAQALPSK
ncbi:hypothetical protein ABTK02_20265, partial [Acinetobacter baumannii]